MAHLVHVDKRWVSLPGEGGHVDFAPNSEEEGIILEVLRAEIGHVSAERVLSGPGLVNLYRAIVKSDGRLPENLQPKDITARALEDSCIDCRRALSLFCVIMGRFGGDLALTLGTFGGVYIAGGIVPRFLDFFKASGFRGGFEDKGRFKAYVQDIPVYLIVHDNPDYLAQVRICVRRWAIFFNSSIRNLQNRVNHAVFLCLPPTFPTFVTLPDCWIICPVKALFV